MIASQITDKIKSRIWSFVVRKSRKRPFYFKIYRSYWHARFNKPKNDDLDQINYFTAIPNRGAGIGHQIANWIAGYWHARQFGLKFAHIEFAQPTWERLLGFGGKEVTANELLTERGFKKVNLPLFSERNSREVKAIKDIIRSYHNQKTLFVAEQDQFYRDQCGIISDLQDKFYSADSRKDDRLIYSKEFYNIAIHVRRGDILAGQTGANENLQMRWQDNSYFEKVLSSVMNTLTIDKPIAIYLFSQGEQRNFQDFDKFANINYCLNMGAQDSFLHMVFADLLITSKSSFSYKPALLSKGIKVCPRNFWHGYPNTPDYILVDDNGVFIQEQLTKLF